MNDSVRVRMAVGLLSLAPFLAAQGQQPAPDPFGVPTATPVPDGEPPQSLIARLGASGLLVGGVVQGIAFSPDGSLLAASSYEREPETQIWDARTGRSLRHVRFAGADISFSADGRFLLAERTKLDLNSGEVASLPGLAASRDDKLVAAAGKRPNELVVSRVGGDVLWSAAVGAADSRLASVAFSPTSDTIVARSSDGIVFIAEAATGKPRAASLKPGRGRLSFSPDGKRLAINGPTAAVNLVQLESGEIEQSLTGLTRELVAVGFSADGRLVAGAGRYESRVLAWDVATGGVAKAFATRISDIAAVALSPDGSRLAVGGRGSRGPNFQVFDVNSGEELFVPDGPRSTIAHLTFAANSRRLATGCADGAIHLWDTTLPKPLLALQGDCSHDLSFSLDGWTLSASGRDGALSVWEADTGDTLLSRARTSGLSLTLSRIAPNNEFVACGMRDGKLEIRKFATGEVLRSIQAYTRAEMGAMAISPDSKLLATSVRMLGARGVTSSVELWSVETGKQIQKFSLPPPTGDDPFSSIEGFSGLLFSPAGDMLAARAGNALYVWELASGKQVHRFETPGAAYCFAPNGRYFVCQLGAGLNLVELITGQPCLVLVDALPSRTQCTALAMSPDGRLLAAGTSPVNGVPLFSLAPPKVDPKATPTDDEIALAWEQLAEADAKAAYHAAWMLSVADRRAVDFLRDRLGPLLEPKIDAEVAAQLVAQLDDDRFEVREKATTALQKLGPAALPHIRQAVNEATLSTEHKFRLARVIATMESATRRFSGEPLRRLRAIGVLERIGTSPAGALLEQLAAGPPTARETLDAQSALVRLKLRLSGP